MEEFRKQIDEVDNKDSLYELRNTLSEAKAATTGKETVAQTVTEERAARRRIFPKHFSSS